MEQSNKGKSLTTSVPSIAVKFHANAEQLEELYPSEDEATKSGGAEAAKSGGAGTSGSSEPESSPMKYFPKLVKRSTSIDITPTTNVDSSPQQSDPWRFFSDIKGKITRSVEDKITDFKSRNAEEGSPLKAKPSAGSSASSPLKDNNSSGVSDSEDFSESSISKTCGIVSTTEGAEMSSDDDTPSIEKDKQHSQRAQVETVQSEGGLRQRFRIFRANLSSSPTTQEGTIATANLKRLYEINTERVEQALPDEPGEVESGVDALEASTAGNLQKEAAEYEEVVLRCLENEYDNISVGSDGTVNVREVTGQDVAQTEHAKAFYSPVGHVDLRPKAPPPLPPPSIKRKLIKHAVVLVLLMGTYGLVHLVSSFFSGLLAGTIMTYTYFAIKAFLTDREAENKPYMIPNVSEIIEIPAVGEHKPLAKYEGWVNELPSKYDPYTYHISQTQPVFLRLQGNLLRMSNTKAKIPKRALWNEPKIKAAFHHHRIYNLLGAKVSLLPVGLARKRHWSKKYPICITLNKEQLNFDVSAAEAKFAEEDKGSAGSKTMKFTKHHHHKGKAKHKSVSYSTQQFSKLAEEDEEYELMDSGDNSRATTPSPEQTSEENGNSPVDMQDDIGAELTEKQLACHNLTAADDDLEGLVYSEISLHDELTSLYTNADENSVMSEDVSAKVRQRVKIVEEDDGSTKIYIFGRIAREKEDWYRRFASATHKGAEYTIQSALDLNVSVSDTLLDNAIIDIEYIKYMLLFNKSRKKRNRKESSASKRSDELSTADSEGRLDDNDGNLSWVNSLLGRILYDCLKSAEFTAKCKDLLQRKLGAIKLPYFIEELVCTELNLGKSPPVFLRASQPVIDERGLWIDLDMSYQGLIRMMLSTKINLMKLKEKSHHEHIAQQKKHDRARSAIYQSDVEDSPESSSDEDCNTTHEGSTSTANSSPLDASGVPIHGLGGTSNASKKLIKIVDIIADSKFFQTATDNRYIKKAMEGVSNTKLRLTVEVKHLFGTLVLNIPPPPSDRLWIGFRPTPDILITALPSVGERNISSLRITTWIEKKLRQEFQKLFVIPNMEDIYLPVMNKHLPQ